MYNHFDGRLVEKTPTYAVIDCNGVGYLLHISLHTYSKIGSSERCKLYAHMVVREDAHVLFGFHDAEERTMFRHLISVSGVGAGTARMILSSLSPAEVQQAIVSSDVAALKSIKGIGEKSAQRIIVDLGNKLEKESFSTITLPSQSGNNMREEALSALIMLGFVKNVAEKAIDKVFKAEGDISSVEQLIKQALKNL